MRRLGGISVPWQANRPSRGHIHAGLQRQRCDTLPEQFFQRPVAAFRYLLGEFNGIPLRRELWTDLVCIAHHLQFLKRSCRRTGKLHFASLREHVSRNIQTSHMSFLD